MYPGLRRRYLLHVRIVSWTPGTPGGGQALLAFLQRHEPEVLCLHATEVLDDDFPLHALYDEGYYAKIHGAQGGPGVALISPEPPRDVRRHPEREGDGPLVLSGTLAGMRVVVGGGDSPTLVQHVRRKVAAHEAVLVVDRALGGEEARGIQLTRLAPEQPFFARGPLAERSAGVEMLDEHPAVRLRGVRALDIPDRFPSNAP